MVGSKRSNSRYTAPKRSSDSDSTGKPVPELKEPIPGKTSPTSAPNVRYTPPKREVVYVPMRPDWHRWLAIGLLVAGLLIVVLNDAQRFTKLHLLPFGHRELYLLLGLFICGLSGRFFGIFDREP